MGSVLFHATLKYEMQIIDEMPMYTMASFTCVVLYARDNYDFKNNTFYIYGRIYQFTVGVLLTIIFLFTEQSHILHLIG